MANENSNDQADGFPVEQCDVEDKTNLIAFREKQKEWRHWLSGDPDHSILNQIWAMLWNNAVFRVVNESWRIAEEEGGLWASRNAPLAEFIDQGFIATQALYVRRLLESGKTDPRKQVISLRRLLDDVEKNGHLITREVYLSQDGLPFDPEPVKAGHIENALKRNENGVHVEWVQVKGPKDWDASERNHETFDMLSVVSADARHRSDKISSECFSKLRKTLDDSGADKIIGVANKLIAHAADETSREKLDERRGFSFDELDQCHHAIIAVTNCIGSTILQADHVGSLPHPQFDWSEGLDCNWIPPRGLLDLHRVWDEYAATVDRYCRDDAL